jgi:cytosine deaminase
VSWAALRQAVECAAQGDRVVLRGLRAPACVLPFTPASTALAGLCTIDLTIERGKLAQIRAAASGAGEGISMGQRIVWPAAVDCHTHIDKGQVWARGANPDGTFEGALDQSGIDAATYQSDADVRARAGFSLASAYAHGTALLRTHVDAAPETFDRRFAVLQEVAQEWTGRVEVQLCPFSGVRDDPGWLIRLAQAAKATRARTLSFFLRAGATLDADLDRIIRCAADHGLALDFHADETLDPASDCLGSIARALIRHQFDGPVMVGHCCALSVQDDAAVARTLDRVAQTGIGIVALPLCNMYLQDRFAGHSPRHRGIAPLKEIRARGIPVAIGSDNTRDAFYAYGDLDVPDLFRDALRMMQLDHPVGHWPATVLNDAASLIGAPERGRLTIGAPADLILFSARNWSEFTARPQHDRMVLRAGRSIDTTPPDFADLDTLEGMHP